MGLDVPTSVKILMVQDVQKRFITYITLSLSVNKNFFPVHLNSLFCTIKSIKIELLYIVISTFVHCTNFDFLIG